MCVCVCACTSEMCTITFLWWTCDESTYKHLQLYLADLQIVAVTEMGRSKIVTRRRTGTNITWHASKKNAPFSIRIWSFPLAYFLRTVAPFTELLWNGRVQIYFSKSHYFKCCLGFWHGFPWFLFLVNIKTTVMMITRANKFARYVEQQLFCRDTIRVTLIWTECAKLSINIIDAKLR